MKERSLGRRLLGYETDLRFSVLLLVVLMAVLNQAVAVLLERSIEHLEQSEKLQLRRAGRLLQEELPEEIPGDPVVLRGASPSTLDRYTARLDRWADRTGLDRIVLLDRQGRRVVPPARAGRAEWDHLARWIDLEERQGLSGPLLIPPHQDRFGILVQELVLPYPPSAPSSALLLRVTRRTTALHRLQRSSRLVHWLRAGSLGAALLLTVLYVRLVLRPYRLIAQRARDMLTKEAPSRPRPPSGEIGYVLDTFERTIRELREKERELETLYRDSERRVDEISRYNEHILRSVPVGLVALDWMGRVTSLNPVARRILDLTGQEGIGCSIEELAGGDSPLTGWVARGLPAGERLEAVGWVMRRAEPLHLEVSASPLFDQEGHPIGGVAIAVDATERNRLEALVTQRRRLAELGEMSAGIAHEFRNPLQTVLGYANLMQRKLEEEHPHQEFLGEVVRVVERLDKTIRDFMSFVRPTVLDRTPTDLRRLTREILDRPPIRKAAGSCLMRILDGEELPLVPVDQALVGQVLENLFMNAFQAMGEEGELQVELLIHRVAEVPTGGVRILVSDCGPGIPVDQMEKLFSPFVTSRADGTGLGLAIAQRIVVAHDGWIVARNRPDLGAQFEVMLPGGG